MPVVLDGAVTAGGRGGRASSFPFAQRSTLDNARSTAALLPLMRGPPLLLPLLLLLRCGSSASAPPLAAPPAIGITSCEPCNASDARQDFVLTTAGATCCLALSRGGPAPSPAPPAPPPGEEPCRGHLVEVSAGRIRIGVCVGDMHNNATYLSSLSTLSGSPPRWSGSVLMPVGISPEYHGISPEQTYDSMLSTTSVEVVDSAGKRTWNAAKGGRVTHVNASSVEVSDVQLRSPSSPVVVAEETWRITAMQSGAIVWELERTWMADVQLCADRFPALLLVKGIWSMFDSTQVMNMSSGAGFASAPDPTAGSGVWFEAIYPQHKRQLLRQSPTGAQIEMEIAAHTNFSLATAMLGAGGARPGDDVRRVSAWQWIGGPTAVGATTVNRESGCDVWDLGQAQPPQAAGRATTVGPVQPSLTQRLTLSVPPMPEPSTTTLASAVTPAFHLRTGDAELDRRAAEFATVFMMPRGGVYGNSAYSISCLHELSLLPQIMGVFGGEQLGGFGEGQTHTSANDVMATQLRLFAETALHDANAYLYMRHDWGGYENNTIRDQVPHFLLAFWYHSVNTGDKQLVRDCWPAIEKVVHYLLNDMRMEADGIPTVPGVSGLPHGYDSPVCTDPHQHICPSNW